MLVLFQFSDAVIFQAISPTSTAALMLIHTHFPLKISGKYRRASEGRLMGVLHCSTASSSGNSNLSIEPPRRGPLSLLVPLSQSSKFVPFPLWYYPDAKSRPEKMVLIMAFLRDSSKFPDPFHQSSSSRKRSYHCINSSPMILQTPCRRRIVFLCACVLSADE